jgi:hypothetical protein
MMHAFFWREVTDGAAMWFPKMFTTNYYLSLTHSIIQKKDVNEKHGSCSSHQIEANSGELFIARCCHFAIVHARVRRTCLASNGCPVTAHAWKDNATHY